MITTVQEETTQTLSLFSLLSSPSSAIRKPTLLQIALKINVQLLSQSYLAFPRKRGSVTLAEIPPPLKFAEI